VTEPAMVTTDYGKMFVQYVSGAGGAGVVGYFDVPAREPIPIRLHSSCLFSESLGAIDCDCSTQLSSSLRIISEKGGYLIYAYEEGRGAVAMLRGQACLS
jgi:GTP cyclohydrolase II